MGFGSVCQEEPSHEHKLPATGVDAARHRLAHASGWPQAALVRQRARLAAAAALAARYRRSLSQRIGNLEFSTSSTPCAYAAAPRSRLADVHGSGGVLSFTRLMMALGSGLWSCSTDWWSLAAAEYSQSAACSVCA